MMGASNAVVDKATLIDVINIPLCDVYTVEDQEISDNQLQNNKTDVSRRHDGKQVPATPPGVSFVSEGSVTSDGSEPTVYPQMLWLTLLIKIVTKIL